MKVLWIPIFSMRSYDTGKYSITKDGNFQLAFARILASGFDSIVVALPDNSTDFQEFMNPLYHQLLGRDIKFHFLRYGNNAVDTRKRFWQLNRDFFYSEQILDYDLIITDITGYAGTMSYDLPFVNNFNVTKLPELNRPYIDEFWEKDLESMEKALFTTVINPRQREYILEVAPHLANKVMAYTKVAHSEMLPVKSAIKQKNVFNRAERTIFWPFRISDKAYKFNEFIGMLESQYLDKMFQVVITDPNDSYCPSIIHGDSSDDSNVRIVKPSKSDYYEMLQQQPIVVMLDDIDTVLHPGTVEFMHYGCKLITLENKLIPHNGMVKSIAQIPQKLMDLVYNSEINTDNFVYSKNEISAVYSEKFINQCVQNS